MMTNEEIKDLVKKHDEFVKTSANFNREANVLHYQILNLLEEIVKEKPPVQVNLTQPDVKIVDDYETVSFIFSLDESPHFLELHEIFGDYAEKKYYSYLSFATGETSSVYLWLNGFLVQVEYTYNIFNKETPIPCSKESWEQFKTGSISDELKPFLNCIVINSEVKQ